MVEIEPGVLARKASSACVGAPRELGHAFRELQERLLKHQQQQLTNLQVEHCYVAGTLLNAWNKLSLYPYNSPKMLRSYATCLNSQIGRAELLAQAVSLQSSRLLTPGYRPPLL